MTPTLPLLYDELTGLQFAVDREGDRMIHERTGHNGRSAHVQVSARRQ